MTCVKPREKLLAYGVNALSDTELLAILLNTGSRNEPVLALADRVLKEYNGISGLARVDINLLSKNCKGIGDAKTATMAAAFAAGRRALSGQIPLARCNGPAEVADFLVPALGCLMQEEFHALYLDSRKQVIRQSLVSRGTLRQSLVHPADVFRPAVASSCDSVLLAHNHPSGDPTPSSADFATTKRLVAAGRQLCIEVVDHIVIGGTDWISIRSLDSSLFD